MTKEELQELIDAGLINMEDDKKVYDHLYNDLGSEDKEYKVSAKFIKNLSSEIEKSKKQTKKEVIILSAVIGTMGIVALVLFIALAGASLQAGAGNWIIYSLIFIALYFVFRKIENRFLSKAD